MVLIIQSWTRWNELEWAKQIQQRSFEFHQESTYRKHLRKHDRRRLPPPPPLPPLLRNHHHPEAHPQNRATKSQIMSKRIPSKTHTDQTHWIIYHSYNQTATRTSSNVFTICKLLFWYFETVSARTWIMIYTFLIVPWHILDFNLIVVGTHFWNCRISFIRNASMYSDPEERASVNLDHEWSMHFDSTMTELERNVTCQWREGFVNNQVENLYRW